jgi:UDP-4-amino-4,6-dideoxy-N-acetyl-beta-L-altrosamine transaminase
MTVSQTPKALEDELAIRGGHPVREAYLAYGRQTIDDADRAAVAAVLASDWITTGPKVRQFEEAFARAVGAREAVAVNSGTAALHAAMHALGIGPGDEVVIPSITFAATANAVVYLGGTPVFADVDPETLLITAESAARCITSRTKAIVAVDYGGQSAEYDELRTLAAKHGLPLVADACHALGGSYRGRKVGTLADLNAFSFHPVKPITTGEGGMITTDDADFARQMRIFRTHGITTDHHYRQTHGEWAYEMQTLGFNYRLSDFACALGLSQLGKLDGWVRRRNELADHYRRALSELHQFVPLRLLPERTHAYHLFVVRCRTGELGWTRDAVFAALRAEGIGVNVHYIPVYLHPFYRERFNTRPGLCPNAEAAFAEILTLPLFATMTDRDVDDVCRALRKIIAAPAPA